MSTEPRSLEPWMRGYLTGIDPIQAAVLYSFQHALEDIEKWTEGIDDTDLWARYGNLASAGFHIRHIAGSVDRLITYASGGQLSETQLNELKSEHEGGMSRSELLDHVRSTFARAETIIRAFDPTSYADVREIGRRKIPAPLGVLLVHIAEHTQRHVGELIMTVKVIREEYR